MLGQQKGPALKAQQATIAVLHFPLVWGYGAGCEAHRKSASTYIKCRSNARSQGGFRLHKPFRVFKRFAES